DREGGRAGVSNGYIGLAFVGDTLYVAGSDAGPWAGVWSFGLDGRALGELDTGDSGIWDGALGPLDAHRIGLATYALESFDTVDAATDARTTHTRTLQPTTCVNADYLVDFDKLTPWCRPYA